MNIIHGDCLEEVKKLEDNSVDAVITDPPYGLSNTKPAQVADVLAAWVTGETEAVPAKRGGFMGQDWDSFVPPPAVWQECMRGVKPGGHMAVFAGARTQDLMGLSIRLAGFEIRDTLGWIYGSGFPKSMDISKAIDKAAGKKGKVIGERTFGKTSTGQNSGWNKNNVASSDKQDILAPATPEAERWSGWGTALKPAIEPIILARKPLDGTVANNVLAYGVGGLNIDACRVPSDVPIPSHHGTSGAAGVTMGKYRDYVPGSATAASASNVQTAGRFPANVLLDEHAAAEMDEQSGVLKSGGANKGASGSPGSATGFSRGGEFSAHNDSGGASRFFPVFKYQAKAPKKERPVIEREAVYGLRDDLTEDQVDYVLARLREAGVETG